MAAGIVGALGTTDARELRREVPWYGTLFNHAAIIIAAVVAGFFFELPRAIAAPLGGAASSLVLFAGLMISAVIYFLLNGLLAVVAVSTRTGTGVRTILAQDIQAIALNLVGLAPVDARAPLDRHRNVPHPAIGAAPEKDHGGSALACQRQQRPEIGICRNDSPVFVPGASEHRLVLRGSQAVVAHVHGIVTAVPQALREDR